MLAEVAPARVVVIGRVAQGVHGLRPPVQRVIAEVRREAGVAAGLRPARRDALDLVVPGIVGEVAALFAASTWTQAAARRVIVVIRGVPAWVLRLPNVAEES